MGRIKKPKHGPEWHIQRRLKDLLRDRGWLVEQTHGNLFQKGFPDLFIAHTRWGMRWIDCKVDRKYEFTRDQQRKWPVWDSFGVGIWILVDATQEEYDKLFQPPNWAEYWKDKYGEIDIDALLDELDNDEESTQAQ